MDVLLEHALQVNDRPGVELLPGERLTDLEYADDVLMSADAAKLQRMLDGLTESAIMFGMRFAPSKCKTLLQNWADPAPSFTLDNETLEVVGKFT